MAVVTVFELYDIVNGSFNITARNKQGASVTVISSDNAKKYIVRRFGTRRYKVLRGTPATVSDASNDFAEDFNRYIDNRQHNIDVLYQGLYEENYNPTENVFEDVTENTITNDDLTHGHALTKAGTDTTTYNSANAKTGTDSIRFGKSIDNTGGDSTEHEDGETITHKTAGFNSGTFTNNTQDTTTGGYSDTSTHHNVEATSGTDTTTYNTSDAKTGTDTNTRSETETNSGKDERDISTVSTRSRHGNVGTIASSELLEREIELRLKSLAEMLIDNFINDYTFYS